jgi:hypothetical protein
MKAVINNKAFKRDMNNIMEYSLGFLEGIQGGKSQFLKNIGTETIDLMKQYLDSSARLNPSMLQHVYEWYKVGSPDARLYDITYTVSNLGLSFKSTFRQSTSIKNGSTVPFYNKAKIMEYGIPVTIRPKKSPVLVFKDGSETVFTRNPITIVNPGGNLAQGGFEKTFDSFFNKYFTQAFLRASGIDEYLKNPIAYKKNLPAGKKMGKPKGFETGYRWIANAGVSQNG